MTCARILNALGNMGFYAAGGNAALGLGVYAFKEVVDYLLRHYEIIISQ